MKNLNLKIILQNVIKATKFLFFKNSWFNYAEVSGFILLNSWGKFSKNKTQELKIN